MDLMLPPEYLHKLHEAYEFVSEFAANLESEIILAEKKPMLFIAGPYSSPYPVYNTRRAQAWYDLLSKSQIIIPYCPHFTMYQDLLFPQPYEAWLRLDKQMVMRADALLRLIGDSSGADGELNLAKKYNKPVFFEDSYRDVFPWAINWIKSCGK